MPLSISNRAVSGGIQASSRIFADDTTLAPAAPLAPTQLEFQVFASNNNVSRAFIYYTGTDLSTDTPIEVYHADLNGIVTPVSLQTSGAGGGVDVIYSAFCSSSTTFIPEVANDIDLDHASWTEIIGLANVNTATNEIIPPSTGIYNIKFNMTGSAQFDDQQANWSITCIVNGIANIVRTAETWVSDANNNADDYRQIMMDVNLTLSPANTLSFQFNNSGTAVGIVCPNISVTKLA